VGGDGFGKRDATRPVRTLHGIRPRVWIAAAALIAPAFAVLVATLEPQAPASAATPVSHARAVATVVPAIGTASPPHSASVHSRPAPEFANARATAREAATRAEFAIANGSASSAAVRTRIDSRLASDLRIAEDEAARHAESLGLADADSAPAATGSDRADEDARRTALADAFLVDFFVQDAYRGTEFPIGYPAEARTRAAAISRVAALDPAQRSAQLEVALQQAGDARVEARFAAPESGLVWEAVLR
jgi:hypothetical protein